MTLDLCQNFVSAQYPKNLLKFSICVEIGEINVGNVMRKVLQILITKLPLTQVRISFLFMHLEHEINTYK